jgi:hypothetical protein
MRRVALFFQFFAEICGNSAQISCVCRRPDFLDPGQPTQDARLEKRLKPPNAVGRIVRVEHRFGVTGVAVKLISPRLELLD